MKSGRDCAKGQRFPAYSGMETVNSSDAGPDAPHVHVALVHYPVIDKQGRTIASAVTNLDLHDIARACRTYGVRSFFVTTPLKDQQELVESILAHWIEGRGGAFNPWRKEALELVRLADSLDEAIGRICGMEAAVPETVVTGARPRPGSVGFRAVRERIAAGLPVVLVFGTAWGLSEEIFAGADHVLEPIGVARTHYNHLSVRSAASIVLDRLMGPPIRETHAGFYRGTP